MTTRRLGRILVALLVWVLGTTAFLHAATAARRAGGTERRPTTRGRGSGHRGRGPEGRRGPSGLTLVAPSAHREDTDPEIAKAMVAFGVEDYAKARTIAEAVIKKPDRGGRRGEALDVIVESWLLQGDFAQARAAAQKYSREAPKASRDALLRVNAQEKGYHDDLKQLEDRKRKVKKPERRAHLELLIGHTHRKVGHLAEAEKSYRTVIAKYPKTQAAAMAKRQLESLHPGGTSKGRK